MSFLRDVAPYYLPCYVFVVSHVVYHFTSGNLILPILLAYMLSYPVWGKYWGEKETNLDPKSEVLFKNDKRFMGPLYAFVLCDWLTWIWCFYIVSSS